jgi:O-antigen ligase
MIAAGFIYVTRNKDIFQFLGNRFSDVSQDSRLTIWKESLHILAGAPDGRGIRNLTTHVWAHNLFLDVGLANGWIALFAIMAFCATGFFLAWRSSRQPDFSEGPMNIIMLGWFLAGFLSLMVLPPLLPLLAIVYISLAYFAPYRTGHALPAA